MFTSRDRDVSNKDYIPGTQYDVLMKFSYCTMLLSKINKAVSHYCFIKSRRLLKATMLTSCETETLNSQDQEETEALSETSRD